MKSHLASVFCQLTIACLSLAGCGSDSGGSLSAAATETGKWVGNYGLTGISAFNQTSYDTYQFTVSSGSCGFRLSEDTGGWYLLKEANDCKITDEWGDQYPMVSASSLKIKIDSFGSLSQVDQSSVGTSSNYTSSATILEMDLTFGTTSAVMRTTTRLVSGDIANYTYSYTKR